MPEAYRRRCYLNNPRRVRLQMTKIAREMYGNDPACMPLPEARLLLAYLQSILQAFKQEDEMSLSDRLAELEKLVEARGG